MYKKTIALTPNNIFAYIGLAGTYGFMGREEEAKSAGAEVLRIDPKWSIDYSRKRLLQKIRKDCNYSWKFWRKAGLPDKPNASP